MGGIKNKRTERETNKMFYLKSFYFPFYIPVSVTPLSHASSPPSHPLPLLRGSKASFRESTKSVIPPGGRTKPLFHIKVEQGIPP